MFILPPDLFTLLMHFAPVFSPRVLPQMGLLVTGTLLTPGRRTVTNARRVLGRQHQAGFQNFHRLLNRARWSSRDANRRLFRLLVERLVPEGPVLLGLDETLERRQGERIAAQGVYREAARSSKAYLNKAGGLRWISRMLLTGLPWTTRVWALPFFTVLAPSERYHQERGKPQKKLADWARQMLAPVRRWLPDRPLVGVADSSYAALTLLAACQKLATPVTLITRLRLDAAL